MKKGKPRTATADKAWFHYLSDHCNGSSGKGGNLIGMRNLYWGKDAFVIRCDGYLFRVSEKTFDIVTGREM